ncbi:MAG: hypothetical protein K8S24_11105 [Candidatus Aegiribacteria sp.]|nr:hypothetical protein [Candidatus Aegiribacteria sp.]
MVKRPTAHTAAAGEYYVAYELSKMGYSVGLTREGLKGIDLVVGGSHNSPAVLIQVKTSSSAWRPYKKDKKRNRWEWDVGSKSRSMKGKYLFYVFVDLRKDVDQPEVFIVPSDDVAEQMNCDMSRYIFRIPEHEGVEYKGKWNRIEEMIKG